MSFRIDIQNMAECADIKCVMRVGVAGPKKI